MLDEPTIDLDLETLELLEDMLLDFHGTLLLVSHDRAFLNNLVTSTLVLDGSGQVRECVGGYDDWVRQSQAEASNLPEELSRQPFPALKSNDSSPQKRGISSAAFTGKLSFKEKRLLEARKQELAELPQRIEALEEELAQLYQR